MIDESEQSDARGLQDGSQFFHSCVNRMIGGDMVMPLIALGAMKVP